MFACQIHILNRYKFENSHTRAAVLNVFIQVANPVSVKIA